MATFFGVLALALSVSVLISKQERLLLAVLGIAVSLWAVHYALLGSWSGFATHAVAAASLLVAHHSADAPYYKRRLLAVLFTAVGVGFGAYWATSSIDLIACFGCLVMTPAQFMLRGLPRRYAFLAGEGFFLWFAFAIGSWPGVLVTLSNLAAGMIGISRLKKEAVNLNPEPTS